MTRPTGNADKKLIKAALEIFPETGFTNLTIRDVVKRAGVNLGMFHYHFKSKKEFIRFILQDIYEQFFETFKIETAVIHDPETRLRNAVKAMSRFVRKHRKVVIPLVNDILLGHQEVQTFLAKNIHRHVKILLQIIKDCQKKKIIAKLPFAIILPFLLGTQIAPHIIANLLEKTKVPIPVELAKVLIIPVLISDKLMETRLDLAMKALRPEGSAVKNGRKDK